MRGPINQPKLNAMQLSSLDQADKDGHWILLDSGATHALRPAHDEDEWNAGHPTTVMLAQGSTDQFRLKISTQVLLQAPQAPGSNDVATWIIPMGGLADIGCSVEWKGSQCSVRNSQGKALQVQLRHGCPMISKEDGLEILKQLEIHQIRLLKRMLLVKTLATDPGAMTKELDVETALNLKLHQLFPDLPPEVFGRLVPDEQELQASDLGSKVPWNRSKRRRLAKANQVVIHLFSGQDCKFWERRLSSKTTEVLCIDLLCAAKANLLDNSIFSFLLRLAATGRVKAILGGPPCRTVSALRYQQDGGPGVVRSDSHPYGLPTASPSERELVISDSVLFLRFLLLFMVAEEVRSSQEPETAFICEQPQDPATYRSPEDVALNEYFAMWRTTEWQSFAEKYGMLSLSFDQGVMGHAIRKPTTLGTNLDPLLQLHELRCGPNWSSQVGGDRKQQTVQERCRESKTWAAWAPGLKEAIVVCLQHHLQQDGKHHPQQVDEPSLPQPLQEVKRPRLQPLGPVALEQWKKHFENDHYPARRDCAQCLRSQGRGRPHRRIRHADAFTLAVDLSGRLTQGRDQRGKGAKYLLVGAYTFPVTGAGKPLVDPPGVPAEEDHPLPPPGAGVDGEDADPAVPPVPADHHVIADDEALADEGLDATGDGGPAIDYDDDDAHAEAVADDNPAVAAAQSAYTTWHRLVEESSDVACRTLTFVEVLETRRTKHVLAALARIHCRLRSLGLPLLRLHSDRARELIAAPVRRWTLDRGIVATMTSGDSYKSNGRAENEVNLTKKAIRAVLEPGEFSVQDWPLIARHIGERRLRHQLNQLGWPTGPLLRFGTKAFAVRKSWKNRYEDWRQVRESIVVLGPDPHSSISSPSYYVKSLEDGKFFYTDDVVIPESELPVANPAEPPLYLLEQGAAPRQLEWANPPNRRLRGKQSVPLVSMLHIEGETRLMKCCPMVFEPTEGIPATVPQQGKRPPLLQLVDATDCLDESDGGHSDSWTLGTSSSGITTEEEQVGGGDVEEAPNSWCGGSSPAASSNQVPCPLEAVAWSPEETDRQRALKTMHFNLGIHILQEMERLDATTEDQTHWFPALNSAIVQRNQLEDMLHGMQDESAQVQQQQIDAEFLVTKTISQQEVWKNLESWAPSARKEYDQLVNNKAAVKQITRDQLRSLSAELGLPIELLPGKMVHTRKAGSGDYRSRAVVCGNYAETSSSECYAGGADGPMIRAMVKTCALQHWCLSASDVRVAFLNAPRRDRSKLVAMEIPRIFKQLDLCTDDHVWLIEKALYGLTTSPRDWSLHRNEVIPTMTWFIHEGDNTWKGFFAKTEDDNLWRLLEVNQATGEKRWAGLLAVYVDDLLMGGSQTTIDAAMKSIADVWSLSEVEQATSTSAVKFCGFEITKDAKDDGFHLSQRNYEQEILKKWEISEGASWPLFKVTEEDENPGELTEADANDLKQAQALAGSLLWVATRTRPDVMYGVAIMSRLMSKNPSCAVRIGMALLKYIYKVPGGLHYSSKAEGWGRRDQLKIPRADNLIEVYSDIAYASGSGHRSVEGIAVFFGGSPLAWQSHKQPFATHSTAESELVSYCEALIAGRSIEALLCTMWGEPLKDNRFQRVLYGDNVAAIGLAHGTANFPLGELATFAFVLQS